MDVISLFGVVLLALALVFHARATDRSIREQHRQLHRYRADLQRCTLLVSIMRHSLELAAAPARPLSRGADHELLAALLGI